MNSLPEKHFISSYYANFLFIKYGYHRTALQCYKLQREIYVRSCRSKILTGWKYKKLKKWWKVNFHKNPLLLQWIFFSCLIFFFVKFSTRFKLFYFLYFWIFEKWILCVMLEDFSYFFLYVLVHNKMVVRTLYSNSLFLLWNKFDFWVLI